MGLTIVLDYSKESLETAQSVKGYIARLRNNGSPLKAVNIDTAEQSVRDGLIAMGYVEYPLLLSEKDIIATGHSDIIQAISAGLKQMNQQNQLNQSASRRGGAYASLDPTLDFDPHLRDAINFERAEDGRPILNDNDDESFGESAYGDIEKKLQMFDSRRRKPGDKRGAPKPYIAKEMQRRQGAHGSQKAQMQARQRRDEDSDDDREEAPRQAPDRRSAPQEEDNINEGEGDVMEYLNSTIGDRNDN